MKSYETVIETGRLPDGRAYRVMLNGMKKSVVVAGMARQTLTWLRSQLGQPAPTKGRKGPRLDNPAGLR